MITKRDLKLIEFMQRYPSLPLTTEQISKLIYWSGNEKSSLIVAQRRLLELFKRKQLKRSRDYVGQPYLYYIDKKVKQVEHKAKIVDFLCECNVQGLMIEDIQIEFSKLKIDYGIIIDAVVTIRRQDNSLIDVLLEIENKKLFDAKKYERLLRERGRGTVADKVLTRAYMITVISKKKPDNIKYTIGREYEPIWAKDGSKLIQDLSSILNR